MAPTSTPVSSAEESGYGVWPPPKPEATPHESLRLRRERRARLRPFPPLSSSTARLLQDLDFGLFSFHPTCRELLASFRAGPGWLGIGSGASGLLGALRGSGLTPWTWCCDLVSELETTVNGAERRRVLNECIRAGCVQGMYLRPSAGTFSAAVRPPLRSKEFPSGIPSCSLQQRIRLERGNDELAWVQDLCRLANASGVAVVIDHPQNSLLWKQPGWEVCQEASGWADSSFDLCRFGAPFRKPTKLRVRGLFGSQQLRCACGKPHLALRGRDAATGNSWSQSGRSAQTFLEVSGRKSDRTTTWPERAGSPRCCGLCSCGDAACGGGWKPGAAVPTRETSAEPNLPPLPSGTNTGMLLPCG